jgi:hypothetical protein
MTDDDMPRAAADRPVAWDAGTGVGSPLARLRRRLIAADVVSFLVGWSAAWAIARGDAPSCPEHGHRHHRHRARREHRLFLRGSSVRNPDQRIRSGALGWLHQSMGAAMVTIVWQAVLDDVVPELVLSSVTAAQRA